MRGEVRAGGRTMRGEVRAGGRTMRGDVRVGSRKGVGRWRCKRHARERPDSRLGDRARAERT